MAKTMKAAVVRAFGGPLAIEEVPLPTPGPGEVLVKIMASGVCHTDLHAADGDWPVKPALPFIPGHEGAGIVSALGAGVTGLKEGDAVGIAWLHDACGSCEYLHHRMGDALHRAAQQRLQRERHLCGVRHRVGRIRGPTAGPARLRRPRAHPLRRRDDL